MEKGISKLKRIVSDFKGSNVLVVGDLILDEFVWGDVSRISPEAPIPVVEVRDESFMPGGAANVASNICSLGGQVILAGVVGNDMRGDVLKKELKKRGIDQNGLIIDGGRSTTIKTRVIAHRQQVVRIDREETAEIDEKVTDKILDFAAKKIGDVESVVVEDYGKGVIGPNLLREITSLAKKSKRKVIVDPKEGHFSYYRGVALVTPNRQEAEKAVGVGIKDDETLNEVGRKLLEELACDAVLVTLGEDGMCLFQRDGKVVHIPTVAREVYDVSGAGDTVVGAISLALSVGATMEAAARIANCAAGVVVSKVGVSTVSIDELMETLEREGY